MTRDRIALTLGLALTLFMPAAHAHPTLDHERDVLLDEMARHLAAWATPPPESKRAPAAEIPPPAAAPERAAEPEKAPSACAAVSNDDVEMPAPPEAWAPEPPIDAMPEPDVMPEPSGFEPDVEPIAPAFDGDDPSPAVDASSDDAIPLGDHDGDRIALAVLDATNRVRMRHGVRPVVAHPVLRKAAAEYAEHMGRHRFFGHLDEVRPSMLTPGHRVRAAGGVDAVSSENLITETWLQVADGESMYVRDAERYRYSRTADGPDIPPHTYRTLADSMVERWMDSPGHRKNLLDDQAVQMGFGLGWMDQDGLPTLIGVQVFQRAHPLGEGPAARRAARR